MPLRPSAISARQVLVIIHGWAERFLIGPLFVCLTAFLFTAVMTKIGEAWIVLVAVTLVILALNRFKWGQNRRAQAVKPLHHPLSEIESMPVQARQMAIVLNKSPLSMLDDIAPLSLVLLCEQQGTRPEHILLVSAYVHENVPNVPESDSEGMIPIGRGIDSGVHFLGCMDNMRRVAPWAIAHAKPYGIEGDIITTVWTTRFELKYRKNGTSLPHGHSWIKKITHIIPHWWNRVSFLLYKALYWLEQPADKYYGFDESGMPTDDKKITIIFDDHGHATVAIPAMRQKISNYAAAIPVAA